MSQFPSYFPEWAVRVGGEAMVSASRADGSPLTSLVSWPTKKRAPWHAARGPQEETPKAQSGDFTSCRIHYWVLIRAMCRHTSGTQSRACKVKRQNHAFPPGRDSPSASVLPCTQSPPPPDSLPLLLTLQRGHSSRTLNFILFFASSVAVVKLCLCFVIPLAVIFSCCS